MSISARLLFGMWPTPLAVLILAAALYFDPLDTVWTGAIAWWCK